MKIYVVMRAEHPIEAGVNALRAFSSMKAAEAYMNRESAKTLSGDALYIRFGGVIETDTLSFWIEEIELDKTEE